jgi:hypothetical protein
VHDHRIREQLVHGLRILRSWRAEAEPVRGETDLLPQCSVVSHAVTVAGSSPSDQTPVGSPAPASRELSSGKTVC